MLNFFPENFTKSRGFFNDNNRKQCWLWPNLRLTQTKISYKGCSQLQQLTSQTSNDFVRLKTNFERYVTPMKGEEVDRKTDAFGQIN